MRFYKNKVVVFIFSLLLLSVSLFQFFKLNDTLLWQLSILFSECGHIVAFVLFVFLCLFAKKLYPTHRCSLATLIFADLFLFLPLLQFIVLFPQWDKNLKSSFKHFDTPHVLQLTHLIAETIHAPTPFAEKIFSHVDGVDLRLEIYRPAPSEKPVPWVLVIPGGGWRFINLKQFRQMNGHLTRQGYAVVVVTYRLLPLGKWPAPKIDVKKAAEFIIANAKGFNIDPNKWAILGRSAGGQIAESIAYKDPLPGLRGGIFIYAPADMSFAYKFSTDDDILKSKTLIREFMGGEPDQVQANYDDASPILAVNAQTLPTLLIHGQNDSLVWDQQSIRLAAQLKAQGAASYAFLKIPWATHGFDYFFLISPGGWISTYSIDGFLKNVFTEDENEKKI